MAQKQFVDALNARKTYLEASLDQIEAALDTPPPKDFEDRATEREGDEVMESLGTAELAELKQINAALDRVRDGTFGVCVSCGDEISDERLAVLPHTPKCRHCA